MDRERQDTRHAQQSPAGTRKPWVITRQRLIDAIETSASPIVVLNAPAGYGKSTVARQWLAAHQRPTIWYQCRPSASDVVRLASELADLAKVALRNALDVQPFLRRLKGNREPQTAGAYLGEALLECMQANSAALQVTIDDYQVIAGEAAAEEFLASFLQGLRGKIVLTTRDRPAWITARKLLYGDVHEIGSAELAMTKEEASQVLRAGGHGDELEILPLTDGWPALVSLVVLRGETDRVIDGALNEFLSEEVYRALPVEIRESLVLLAAIPPFDLDAAASIIGKSRAERVIACGVKAGLITELHQRYEIHPVFREFLCQLPVTPEVRAEVEACVDALIANALWDEAFELARRFDSIVLLRAIVERGVRPALIEGRAASVRRWLDYARGADVPALNLADAELALRDGLYLRAETLAINAVKPKRLEPRLRHWGYLIAGTAAHLGGREREAVGFYRLAQTAAVTEEDRREAEWGELKAAIDLELPEARALLDKLRVAELTSPGDRIELAARSLVLNARFGRLSGLDDLKSVAQLVNLVDNPLARNSFRNIYAYACALAGEYSNARDVLEALEKDASAHDLHFAKPYIALTRGVLAIAERNFDEGFGLLLEAATDARRTGDVHIAASCAATKARGLIAIGRFDEAAATASYDHRSLIRAMRGELLATRALAVVCSEKPNQALSLASSASRLTGTVEVPVLCLCIETIHASRSGSDTAAGLAEKAILAARAASYVDGVISAYRGYPELARIFGRHAAHGDWLSSLMVAANDRALLQVAGLGLRAGQNVLTRREAEVFALVQSGYSNRQIGAELYITEATAKAHVHNILEKLGARSRTEAALMAPAHPYPKRRPALDSTEPTVSPATRD